MDQRHDLTLAADNYGHIVATFGLGILRLRSAEAAHSRLLVALLNYRLSALPETSSPEPFASVFDHLKKIPKSSYEVLRYITDLSLLIYATTLIDTFLLETTTFLLLMFPRSLGKTQQISVNALITAASTNQLVTEVAIRKAREISFLPFNGRIEYLIETFGLKLTIQDDDREALEHFSSIRNAAVHDQGIFEMSLDESGTILIRSKGSPDRPTPVSEKEIDSAIASYTRVAAAIANKVMEQCLQSPAHPSLAVFSRESINSPQSEEGKLENP